MYSGAKDLASEAAEILFSRVAVALQLEKMGGSYPLVMSNIAIETGDL